MLLLSGIDVGIAAIEVVQDICSDKGGGASGGGKSGGGESGGGESGGGESGGQTKSEEGGASGGGGSGGGGFGGGGPGGQSESEESEDESESEESQEESEEGEEEPRVKKKHTKKSGRKHTKKGQKKMNKRLKLRTNDAIFKHYFERSWALGPLHCECKKIFKEGTKFEDIFVERATHQDGRGRIDITKIVKGVMNFFKEDSELLGNQSHLDAAHVLPLGLKHNAQEHLKNGETTKKLEKLIGRCNLMPAESNRNFERRCIDRAMRESFKELYIYYIYLLSFSFRPHFFKHSFLFKHHLNHFPKCLPNV